MTTLHTLDIPQEPAALGRWLEQQLLGLNLASTIAELRAVHGTPARQQTLEDLLGPHLDRVLRDGLQSLPLPLLQALLRDPELLLPLQELIYLEGGGYWEVRHPSPEIQQLVNTGWERLQPRLNRRSDTAPRDGMSPPAVGTDQQPGGQQGLVDSPPETGQQLASETEARQVAVSSPQSPPARPATAPRRQQAGWWSHPLLVSALSAAAAVVTITFADHYLGPGPGSPADRPLAATDPNPAVQQPSEDPAAVTPEVEDPEDPGHSVASTPAVWGWNRPDAVDPTLPAKEYLNRLADAAAEWNAVKPQSATELARRIVEFRQGCSRLLTAEHQPLPQTERKVLLERCHNWAKNFDTQLSAVEHLPFDADAGELAVVQSKMDTLVDSLVSKLREQAEQLS